MPALAFGAEPVGPAIEVVGRGRVVAAALGQILRTFQPDVFSLASCTTLTTWPVVAERG